MLGFEFKRLTAVLTVKEAICQVPNTFPTQLPVSVIMTSTVFTVLLDRKCEVQFYIQKLMWLER